MSGGELFAQIGPGSRFGFGERIPQPEIVLLLGVILHALDPDRDTVFVQMADLVVGIIQFQEVVFSLESLPRISI
jgi:hypothetical protein